jgi:hypothetical protein
MERLPLHVLRGLDGADSRRLDKGRDGTSGTTTGMALPRKARSTRQLGTIFDCAFWNSTTLHYFGELPDGQGPVGELIQRQRRTLRSHTTGRANGRIQSLGTIFKITPLDH